MDADRDKLREMRAIEGRWRQIKEMRYMNAYGGI